MGVVGVLGISPTPLPPAPRQPAGGHRRQRDRAVDAIPPWPAPSAPVIPEKPGIYSRRVSRGRDADRHQPGRQRPELDLPRQSSFSFFVMSTRQLKNIARRPAGASRPGRIATMPGCPAACSESQCQMASLPGDGIQPHRQTSSSPTRTQHPAQYGPQPFGTADQRAQPPGHERRGTGESPVS